MVEVDGVLTPVSMFPGWGSITSQCPRSGCGAIRTENGFEYWTAFADGYEGYMPMGGYYAGGGKWSWKTEQQRSAERKKPTLKGRRTSKEEKARRDAIAATGIYDNEAMLNHDEPFWAVVGFDDKSRDIITKQVRLMAEDKCAKAFESANLTSVYNMIMKGGLVFVKDTFLAENASAYDNWDGDSKLRQSILDDFDKNRYTNDVTPVGGYKGEYYVALNDRAFTGEDDTPQRVIIHALMHAGGAEGYKDRINSSYTMPDDLPRNRVRVPTVDKSLHDLAWMNYDQKTEEYTGVYNKIMKACS